MKLISRGKKIPRLTGLFAVVALLLPVFPVSATETTSPCPFTWTRNLNVGSVGDDVLKLQQFLNSDPDTIIAISGSGSAGNESINFGMLTKRAVAKFQDKYVSELLVPAGLAKGTGFVGALTRGKLNSLCVSSQAVETPASPMVATVLMSPDVNSQSAGGNLITEDVLTVSAPSQPTPTLAPAGAGSIPFVIFTLTAGSKDVTVRNVTVKRVGLGADGAFASVALTDADGNQIGVEKGLRSNHKADVGDPFVIPAGTSQTFNLVGSMASDVSNFSSQMPALQLDGVTVSGATVVSGTLPVRGTAHTVNSSLVIGIGTAGLSQFDPTQATNRYVNDTNVRFSGIKLTADSREDLLLSSIVWTQAGTVGANDLSNVVTVADGVSYPTTVSDKKFTSVFNPAVVIKKGHSVDVYVQGDLNVSGANRNVKFNINKSADIALSGGSYGHYVLIYVGDNTATSGDSIFTTSDGSTTGNEMTPFFSGSVATVNSGTFTSVGKATGR